MSDSINKNNELENEVSLDMSYFCYSDVIMSSKVVEEGPCCAKKQPANNLPSEVLQILGNNSKPLNQRMKIKAQKEARKDRRLELKANHKSSSNVLNCRNLSCRSGLLSPNILLMSPNCSFRLQCLHLF